MSVVLFSNAHIDLTDKGFTYSIHQAWDMAISYKEYILFVLQDAIGACR
jgi:hypothetical protein